MRIPLCIRCLTAAALLLLAPFAVPPAGAVASHVVISEVACRGPGGIPVAAPRA